MIDLRENQQEIVNQLKQIVKSFTEKDRLSGSLLFAHKDNILYSQGFGFGIKKKVY
ncbi:hypothetical protein ACQKCU_25195 [Heyndrickxia sporothermodurans]